MTHGGKRQGAGRKASRGARKVATTIGITPELKAYLGQCEQSQSEIIEEAIRKTEGFCIWCRALAEKLAGK
jgi:hypothetical protein